MNAPQLPFSTLSDTGLRNLLAQHRIGLTVEEARTVAHLLHRDPTLVEATIWGIQGSEHSSYKSSRRFLKMLPTEGKHVILGPKEDSGIVAITDGPLGKRWGIVISHESHNHPSQIVPYEGAATGVGGTVRDVLCMGARVIGCMDMLRFGDLRSEETRTIANEVARGIAGYGNPLGIPNLGGDTAFDSGFNASCLVNAVAVGLVREDQIIHSVVPEEAARERYDIILIGKPTDRSGFGGAAFASVSLREEEREKSAGAVQEPNPFLERHLLAATYSLFDWLAASGNICRVSFKDLGAGGVVCATVEQVSERGYGAEVNLSDVHVAIADLPPQVIACAETQERLCWMTHPSLTQRILNHYNVTWNLPSVAENAGARVIGHVTADGIYRLRHGGIVVCEARSQDITQGLQYARPTRSVTGGGPEPEVRCEGDRIRMDCPRDGVSLREVFTAMLAHPNHASKSPITLHYDKTVIGQTVIEAGEADAAVIEPLKDMRGFIHGESDPGWDVSDADRTIGVTFGCGGSARIGRISAYAQGLLAATEAICNTVAVGAVPRALTDCLNYGNPEIPEHLGALEDGVRGIRDAASSLGTNGEPVPVISGNVSLYNTQPDGSSIPPSAIVCCIGVLRDASRAVSMRLREPGSMLLLLGERDTALGASAYREVLERLCDLSHDSLLGSRLPTPDLQQLRREIAFLAEIIDAGCIAACHDISDGGLLLALFEMLVPQRGIGGDLGVQVDLSSIDSSLSTDALLFNESPGFILEVPSRHAPTIRTRARDAGVTLTEIGCSTMASVLEVTRGNNPLLRASVPELLAIWERGLADALHGRIASGG